MRTATGASGPPLLLVHGAWHGAWSWEQWVGPLSGQGHDVITIDLPGHGGEVVPSLNRLGLDDYADALAAEVASLNAPPVLIAHSMGGAVVQRLLTRRPTLRLAGVALLASVPPSGVLRTTGAIARRHPGAFAAANATLDLGRLVADPDRACDLFFSHGFDGDDLLRHCARLQSESYRAFLGMLALPRLVKPRDVGVPVLVLGARDDRIFTVAEVERTAIAWRADRVEVLDDLAHDVMLDTNHEKALGVVQEFLDGLR